MSRPHSPSPPAGSPPPEASHERRRAPRRRLRDRIASLDRTTNQALRRPEIANLVMIVEDDLRQTALALGAVEQYLGKAHGLLEQPDVTPQALAEMARDPMWSPGSRIFPRISPTYVAPCSESPRP